MDTITQAFLGAGIGQAGFRSLGRRAVAFGALCGLLPDFDVLLGLGDDWHGLITHRGSSHSLLVLPLVAVPVGWLGWRLLGRRGKPQTWIHLAFWGLITHPLLDVCTTYGTQLFAPLSRQRFSIDAVAILDPVYTLPLIAAVLYGLRRKADMGRSISLARAALGWGLVYLAAGWLWSQHAGAVFTERLAGAGFVPVHLRTPVAPFFPMLRHGVARDANGRIAVATLVPWAPERGTLVVLPSHSSPRVDAVLAADHGQTLTWFSDDLLTVEREDDGALWFYDHRYGMFTDPSWTPFRAMLPAEAPVYALLLKDPGSGGVQLDPAAELRAGWALVVGP
ncbi:MAG: inner membrane protein [Myxococcota bacterium]|jgi:inner membrane protein